MINISKLGIIASTAALALTGSGVAVAATTSPAVRAPRPHISGALLVTGSNYGGPVLYLSGTLGTTIGPTVYLDGSQDPVGWSFYPDSQQHPRFIAFAAVPLYGNLARRALAGRLTVAVKDGRGPLSNTVRVPSPEQEAISGPGS